MTRIEELKEEIKLTERLIKLRKQLLAPAPVCVPFYVPVLSPPPAFPPTYPYIGDAPYYPPIITTYGGETTCGGQATC